MHKVCAEDSPSLLSYVVEEFLTQFSDGNEHTMRLALLIKLVGALEVGEVWYIRVGQHATSAVICTPPGSTLRDS